MTFTRIVTHSTQRIMPPDSLPAIQLNTLRDFTAQKDRRDEISSKKTTPKMRDARKLPQNAVAIRGRD